MGSGWRQVVATATVVILLGTVACSDDEPEPRPGPTTDPDGSRYEASIRRTSFGIPHIRADDWGSLGFGQGYTFAQAHLCTLADQVVKVRSERSRWFGRGEGDANLTSDLAYLALGLRTRAEEDLEGQPEEIVDVVTGYAAGYNVYLRETGVDALPDWCRGEPWVAPITPLDLFTYYRDLALFASGQNLLAFIATAQPPGAPPVEGAGTALGRVDGGDLASNGWAIGSARTASGGGLVLANPHFPWHGERRLWESHLTIPGVVDVYGVGLLGTPGVQIGFTEHVAWTHTVSAGDRLTGYQLTLVPGDPTRYRYGDEERAMTSTNHTVQVMGEDGEVAPVERTLWSSHYGPVVAVPGLDWTESTAYTYRDANIDNDELLAQFLGMNTATSLDQFQQVFRDVGGIPWVNTMAADDTGRAWYADGAATPNLSDAAIDRWQASLETDPIVKLAYDNRLVLLDGSDPGNEWVDAPDARDPGLVPFADQPQLERDDYVFNANDSQWIANPDEPLEGFSPLVGRERERLTLRSRANLRALSGRQPLGIEEVQRLVLGNESYSAELLREEVVARCTNLATRDPILAEACDVLEAWDGRFDLVSRGAVLWRELLSNFPDGSLRDGPESIFTVPFDPDDPANTPRGLGQFPCADTGACLEGVTFYLRSTVTAMKDAGLALDVAVGEVQHALKDDARIAIHGGQGIDGVLNVVNPGSGAQGTTLGEPLPAGEPVARLGNAGLTDEGYRITDGSSFIMVVELTEDGPQGEALLTYSESDDRSSGWFADQTRRFSRKEWRPMRFTDDEIGADPFLEEFEVRG